MSHVAVLTRLCVEILEGLRRLMLYPSRNSVSIECHIHSKKGLIPPEET